MSEVEEILVVMYDRERKTIPVLITSFFLIKDKNLGLELGGEEQYFSVVLFGRYHSMHRRKILVSHNPLC